jgi:hypothetical protein
MSGKVVGWAFDQRVGSPTTKLVLVKLADNANDDGMCWPSVATQAADTELSDRTITREIKRLESQDLIRVEQRVTSRGQVSNVYYLNVPWTKVRKNAPPPVSVSGGAPTKGQRPPDSQSGDTLTGSQGHIENLQVEPSLNLAPPSAPPLSGRAGQLTKEFEPAQLAAWFGGVDFRDGPPLTIVLASRCKCSWVRDKFGDRLRRLFGDDLAFAYEPEHRDD